MGIGGAFRVTNVNVFDSVAGRVDGPFDVTIGEGTIISAVPAGRDRPGREEPGREEPGGGGLDGGGLDGTGKTPSGGGDIRKHARLNATSGDQVGQRQTCRT